MGQKKGFARYTWDSTKDGQSYQFFEVNENQYEYENLTTVESSIYKSAVIT